MSIQPVSLYNASNLTSSLAGPANWLNREVAVLPSFSKIQDVKAGMDARGFSKMFCTIAFMAILCIAVVAGLSAYFSSGDVKSSLVTFSVVGSLSLIPFIYVANL